MGQGPHRFSSSKVKSMLVAALLIIFPFAMIYATLSDIVSMTISNRIPVILTVAFVGLGLALNMPVLEIFTHLGIGIVCLAVTFGFFAAGWMGGGDAKLIAATALWFGPSQTLLEYLVTGSVYGGFLTLGLMAARVYAVPTGIDFVDHLLDQKTGIPYGVALGAAGLTCYSSSTWIEFALQRMA